MSNEQTNLQTVRPTLVGNSPLLLHVPSGTWDGSCGPPKKPPRGLTREQAHHWFCDRVTESLPQQDGRYGVDARMLLEALIEATNFVSWNNRRPFQRCNYRRLVSACVRPLDGFLALPDQCQEWALDIDHGPGRTGDFAAIFRARFDRWAIRPTLQFEAQHVSEAQLRALVEAAGLRVGLGSQRPERRGGSGRFVIAKWETVSDDTAGAA